MNLQDKLQNNLDIQIVGQSEVPTIRAAGLTMRHRGLPASPGVEITQKKALTPSQYMKDNKLQDMDQDIVKEIVHAT